MIYGGIWIEPFSSPTQLQLLVTMHSCIHWSADIPIVHFISTLHPPPLSQPLNPNFGLFLALRETKSYCKTGLENPGNIKSYVFHFRTPLCVPVWEMSATSFAGVRLQIKPPNRRSLLFPVPQISRLPCGQTGVNPAPNQCLSILSPPAPAIRGDSFSYGTSWSDCNSSNFPPMRNPVTACLSR